MHHPQNNPATRKTKVTLLIFVAVALVPFAALMKMYRAPFAEEILLGTLLLQAAVLAYVFFTVLRKR